MDIDQQASALRKKLEQIKFKLDNPNLSANTRMQLEDQVDAITAQLKALEQQLTQLRVTTRKPGGFMQSCVFPCIVKFLVHLLQYLKDTINIIPQTTTKYVVLYENWVSQI